jgi:hypothetical protein
MPFYSLADNITRAWQRAADDLGFAWEPNFHWFSPDSRRHTYLGRARPFGRSGGVLVRILQLGEFPGTTILDRFSEYRRAIWVETLREWGWKGPADKIPAWMCPPR